MNIQREGNMYQVPRWVKQYPEKKVRTVRIVLEERGIILFPMIDLIHVELEEGKHIIAGRIFDIFE